PLTTVHLTPFTQNPSFRVFRAFRGSENSATLPLRFSVSLRVLRGEKTPHYQQLAQAPSETSNLLFGAGMHMPAARQEPRPPKGNFTDH
ncbi:MAG: hypothetical protein RIT02_2600, partial [Planctomycetota bacterium]